jgi:hypothetical protein
VPDIHIRTDALRESSNGLRTVADQVGSQSGHWLDQSFATALSHGGWASSGALLGCANAWQNHMSAVVRQLHDYADRLNHSAGSYDAADQEATRRLRQALTDLDAG